MQSRKGMPRPIICTSALRTYGHLRSRDAKNIGLHVGERNQIDVILRNGRRLREKVARLSTTQRCIIAAQEQSREPPPQADPFVGAPRCFRSQ
eukprot:4704474-Pleurochrysis_carterae.AAC.1